MFNVINALVLGEEEEEEEEEEENDDGEGEGEKGRDDDGDDEAKAFADSDEGGMAGVVPTRLPAIISCKFCLKADNRANGDGIVLLVV